ncbi:hypothetical protein EJ377_02640 [Chryseobacterium arthrosphaerae]|uniref:Uncharacterized protein n=1 Tax=Chryseobacterium arthrosphaerae TaxID=651561 RepID=A0A432DZ23_9FLAO|nr:hypothetical protein EJ377_02640 [Chryseobacterium arthrosphaerae]
MKNTEKVNISMMMICSMKLPDDLPGNPYIFQGFVEGSQPIPLKQYLEKAGFDYNETTGKVKSLPDPDTQQLALRKHGSTNRFPTLSNPLTLSAPLSNLKPYTQNLIIPQLHPSPSAKVLIYLEKNRWTIALPAEIL